MTIPAGVILAGGRSSRMQIKNKAMAPLAGEPMIQHVINRLKPQVTNLILNAAESHGDLARFGLPLVPDITSGHSGPLAGLLASLQYVAESELGEWLLLCPCDAPFLPTDLGERLLECASGKQASLVRYDGILQATFSLWHADVLPIVEHAVTKEKWGGFKPVLSRLPHRVLDWEPADPSPFINVNTPEDLEIVENLFERV